MKPINVIVSPQVAPEEFSDHTDLLEEVDVGYTDLVRLTLENWHSLQPDPESEASLRAALETYLCDHALPQIRSYDKLQSTVLMLEGMVYRIYEGVNHQLSPLLDALGMNVEIRFTRSLYRDAMVRIAPTPETTDAV